MSEARLMIVEDNEEVAQMLMLFLGAQGYKVAVAPDGLAAHKLIHDFLPHLLLLDVGLPDIDGYELLRQFRQQTRTRYIPAIFLTQRNKKSDRLTGLELGADDFITKPFDLEELFLRVQNAIARAGRENLTDPYTGLPAGRIVREEVAAAKTLADRAAIELRLRHTGEFRDFYGALASADLLRYAALMINRVVNTLGAKEDFLGQLDETTFVVVTSAERVEQIRKTIVERFNSDAVQHYGLGERVGENVKVHELSGAEKLLPIIRLEALALK
jgi:DNA-binding response OmpR family regulator